MCYKMDALKKENQDLMAKCEELSRLYLDVSQKARQIQKDDLEGQVKNLELQLDEEREKWDLEHRRYVYCKEVLENQVQEIQKLNIKYEIDLSELKTNHKKEVDKLIQ